MCTTDPPGHICRGVTLTDPPGHICRGVTLTDPPGQIRRGVSLTDPPGHQARCAPFAVAVARLANGGTNRDAHCVGSHRARDLHGLHRAHTIAHRRTFATRKCRPRVRTYARSRVNVWALDGRTGWLNVCRHPEQLASDVAQPSNAGPSRPKSPFDALAMALNFKGQSERADSSTPSSVQLLVGAPGRLSSFNRAYKRAYKHAYNQAVRTPIRPGPLSSSIVHLLTI